MFLYRTILKEAEAEQTIERSRFIAYICPAETREAAEALFARVRAAHRTATHNVPACVIGPRFEYQWASDDGEPQGTSGAPMVQMLVKEGVTNTAIIVTRYFGGVKLGTGGLVRAYTGTAKLALAAAGLCRVEERQVLTLKVEYAHYDKLLNLAEKSGFQLGNPIYADKVTIEAILEPERRGEAENLIAGLTGGNYQVADCRQELVKIPL